MPIVESRPFLTPPQHAVTSTIELCAPVSDVESLQEAWIPGEDISLRGAASFSSDFWEATKIPIHEPVSLVAVAYCLSAKSRWRAHSEFTEKDGAWIAEVNLIVDGSQAAVELAVDLWVVGNGRTGSVDRDRAIHHGAKLWQRSAPLVLSLERNTADFPTSAISFTSTGRRAVAWSVECVAEAEPHWSISSSVRIYVNSDIETCAAIVDGSAGAYMYAAIACDIHLEVLHHLGGWRDSFASDRLDLLAVEDAGCLAALGAGIASSLGLSIDEACRLAREAPLQLAYRSRENLDYFRTRAKE